LKDTATFQVLSIVSLYCNIIMTTSVTRSWNFLVSDRSCPKTDGLRPHHCPLRKNIS